MKKLNVKQLKEEENIRFKENIKAIEVELYKKKAEIDRVIAENVFPKRLRVKNLVADVKALEIKIRVEIALHRTKFLQIETDAKLS